MNLTLDSLYILGLLVTWYGNIVQIRKTIRTKSTKSLSICWILALFASIAIRLPRAVMSTYWAWQVGYVISFMVCAALVVVVLMYRKKYPRR